MEVSENKELKTESLPTDNASAKKRGKGAKVYNVVNIVFLAICCIIHFVFCIMFLDVHFNQTSPLGTALALVLLGIIWFVGGGISSVISLILSCVQFKFSVKRALIYILITLVVSAAGFCCWYLCIKT